MYGVYQCDRNKVIVFKYLEKRYTYINVIEFFVLMIRKSPTSPTKEPTFLTL